MERVIGTKQIGGDRYEIVQTGSGKGAKRFLRKVGKAIKKGAKFVKKNKLISKGLSTVAAVAPLDPATKMKLVAASRVAKKAGFGKDKCGCSKVQHDLMHAHSGVGLKSAGRGLKTAGRHGGSGKKSNPWLAHVKAYRAKHPNKSFKDSLKEAKKTYKKGSGLKTAGRPH
jgi:hypothetical protein